MRTRVGTRVPAYDKGEYQDEGDAQCVHGWVVERLVVGRCKGTAYCRIFCKVHTEEKKTHLNFICSTIAIITKYRGDAVQQMHHMLKFVLVSMRIVTICYSFRLWHILTDWTIVIMIAIMHCTECRRIISLWLLSNMNVY